LIHIVGSPSSNAKAVYYAYKDLGVACEIVTDPADLASSRKIVLPGVGAFGSLSSFLHESNFIHPLRKLVDEGIKLLGICLGMQILGMSSDESPEASGLELVELKSNKFQEGDLRVPHTGWDQISIRTNHEVFEGLNREFSAYFSHSYYLPVHKELTLATTSYGSTFTSVIAKRNLVGVQFHPERSQRSGRKILSNFADW
jgi:glutamine amidotransferase